MRRRAHFCAPPNGRIPTLTIAQRKRARFYAHLSQCSSFAIVAARRADLDEAANYDGDCWKQATSYWDTLLGFLEFCGCSPAYTVPALPSGLNAEPGAELALPGRVGVDSHDWFGCPVVPPVCGSAAKAPAVIGRSKAVARVMTLRFMPDPSECTTIQSGIAYPTRESTPGRPIYSMKLVAHRRGSVGFGIPRCSFRAKDGGHLGQGAAVAQRVVSGSSRPRDCGRSNAWLPRVPGFSAIRA